jgi:prepilin peptidase dependent protein D
MGLDHSEAGFSLLELMVCLVIVSILMMLALPSYQHYLRRAYYLEVVQAAMPYKLGVAACFQRYGSLSGCNGGERDVPGDRQFKQGGVASVVTRGGQIIVIPRGMHGIDVGDDYILTPEVLDDVLVWHASGRGVALGYAR